MIYLLLSSCKTQENIKPEGEITLVLLPLALEEIVLFLLYCT